MARLIVRGLTVPAGDLRIGPVDLEVEAGACLALRGPSGSGKSTILRGIAGLTRGTLGEVLLNGKAPSALGVPAFRRRVVLLSSTPALGDATVREALARPFGFKSADGVRFDPAEAKRRLDALGLAGVLDREVAGLSSGERQRVALTRALLVCPHVLLADEPTSALDPAATQAAETMLAEARTDGLALVLVSHDAAQRARLADRQVDLP